VNVKDEEIIAEVKFRPSWDEATYLIRIIAGEYEDGTTSLRAEDAETGEAFASLSVHVPDEDVKPGEIILKEWSENEELAEVLIRHGILELVKDAPHVFFNYVVARRYRVIG
jgi:uncharacterized protein (UPF0248 family)